jgi:hypothetical protein
MNFMLRCAPILLMLVYPVGTTLPQIQKPWKESLKVRAIKVERIQEDREGQQWFRLRLVVRDSSSRLYHVQAECISTAPDADLSCGNYIVPRVGLDYAVVDFGDVDMQFPEAKTFYTITSVEISDCSGSERKTK